MLARWLEPCQTGRSAAAPQRRASIGGVGVLRAKMQGGANDWDVVQGEVQW
jgi:hypothetical protein